MENMILTLIGEKIAAIKNEEKQYTRAIMKHMRGDVELGPGQFKWNRENLVRCTHILRVLTELYNEATHM